MSFHEKYLKYKSKYLSLKGGAASAAHDDAVALDDVAAYAAAHDDTAIHVASEKKIKIINEIINQIKDKFDAFKIQIRKPKQRGEFIEDYFKIVKIKGIIELLYIEANTILEVVKKLPRNDSINKKIDLIDRDMARILSISQNPFYIYNGRKDGNIY